MASGLTIGGPELSECRDQTGPVGRFAAKLSLNMFGQCRFLDELILPKEEHERVEQALAGIAAGDGVEPRLNPEGSQVQNVITPNPRLGAFGHAAQSVLARGIEFLTQTVAFEPKPKVKSER